MFIGVESPLHSMIRDQKRVTRLKVDLRSRELTSELRCVNLSAHASINE
jgi:hypothetical protein